MGGGIAVRGAMEFELDYETLLESWVKKIIQAGLPIEGRIIRFK